MAPMLILASQSPRRRELLERAGIPFKVIVADVPEELAPRESADDYVRRLAQSKASAVPGELVLGADTVVVVDDQVLEKPADVEDARRMLQMLSGRWHRVLTGVCLKHGAQFELDVCETIVHFSALTEVEIANYVATGEPMGKAGAYAIQGAASKFIPRIEGDYCNVVGLPIALVYTLLKRAGVVAA
ncbi:MAG TPA: Maf family protein [Bryobacteraceae bacterium]|nr:Maf family protein [Bryobacteraceae bacterium]